MSIPDWFRLVEERLAAYVQIAEPITSVYRWQGSDYPCCRGTTSTQPCSLRRCFTAVSSLSGTSFTTTR
jgi:hypothetical protein